MNIKIRPYNSSTDYIDLTKLLHDIYDSAVKKNTFEKHYLNNDRQILVAVNCDVNKIIGSIFLKLEIDYIRHCSTLFFSYLAVDKQYRNKGVASLLLHNAELYCKK